MMNNENSILFSQGLQISNANGDIDKTSYKAVYSGNKGKMLIKNKGKSYYIEANENDIIGCTDPTANNFNSDANIDSGDCLYYVIGCSDILATNYDPQANYDPLNELCQYA